jgi:hypothetical protein
VALASLILRVGLFFLGKDKGRLAKIASMIQSIGMVPVTAFAWASNLAMFGLLVLMLAYLIAPQPVTDFLANVTSPPR